MWLFYINDNDNTNLAALTLGWHVWILLGVYTCF